MGKNQYDCLHSWSTLSTQCKMRDSNKNHDIIIRNGFKHGVYFSIFCRECNMLRSKEWIIDNVMNRALSLLQRRSIVYGKKYLIFNT